MDTLDQVKQHWNSLGIDHFVSDRNDSIKVHQIIVPKNKRGQGIGSIAMESLTKHADKVGKRIELSPSTDYGASSKSRLVKFYKSHGFVENKGKNKDYSISETMYRKPNMSQKNEQILDELMSQEEKDAAERIIHGLKKHQDDFKKRYGANYKSILYAIANKNAQKKQDI